VTYSCKNYTLYSLVDEHIENNKNGLNSGLIDLTEAIPFHWDTIYVMGGGGFSCDSARKIIPYSIGDCNSMATNFYLLSDGKIIHEEFYEPYWDEPNEDRVYILDSTYGVKKWPRDRPVFYYQRYKFLGGKYRIELKPVESGLH
jgi:hypothetical protein